MTQTSTIAYGPHSPFDEHERPIIEAVHQLATDSSHPAAADLAEAIENQVKCLNQLGEVFSGYPSPVQEQRLGDRRRGLPSLVEALSQSNPANYEFYLPTRAIVGRTLAMAESNFYRLLRHICLEIADSDTARHWADQVAERLRTCLYTLLAEDVLSALASDDHTDSEIRSKSVVALAQIWDRRLTYRVSDFFPILDATWDARRRVIAVGGTLQGMAEVFELFRAGCDQRFVDFFVRPNPSPEEIEAFREFLFGRTAEQLKRMSRHMVESGKHSVDLRKLDDTESLEGPIAFYEFFRSRHLQAMARRLAHLTGPKRTAEGYVMVAYLTQMTD